MPESSSENTSCDNVLDCFCFLITQHTFSGYGRSLIANLSAIQHLFLVASQRNTLHLDVAQSYKCRSFLLLALSRNEICVLKFHSSNSLYFAHSYAHYQHERLWPQFYCRCCHGNHSSSPLESEDYPSWRAAPFEPFTSGDHIVVDCLNCLPSVLLVEI